MVVFLTINAFNNLFAKIPEPKIKAKEPKIKKKRKDKK